TAAALNEADIQLNLSGSQARHRLTLSLENRLQTLAVELTGGLTQQRWLGRLANLHLNSPQSGPWQQQSAAELELAKGHLSLQGLCLLQDGARFCGDGRWQSGELQSSGRLTNLGLARFVQGLPEGSMLEGSLGANFDLSGPVSA